MRLLAAIVVVLMSVAPVRAQPCAEDAALARAAGALLAGDHRPTAAEVLHAARDAGSDAPTVEALLLPENDAERRARAVERRTARFDAPLACGEARSEGRLLLLIAPRAGRLEQTGSGLIATVAEGWRAPQLHARDVEGTAWQAPVRPGERLALPLDLAPPITVQLVAEGPRGPRPIAERVIGAASSEAGVSATRGPEARGRERIVPDSDEPIARRLDRLRAASRTGELRSNRLLARVADRHAREVCARGAVGHVTDEGDPERRLARDGVRARHVGETVARAVDASHAYAAMLRSPSHRSALADRRFTDVGIGEARAEGRTCLVVLLAAWPRAVPWSGRF